VKVKHLIFGVGILLFGIIIGGVGLVSAGIGIGIPMIPIGIYFTYRGWRIYKYQETIQSSELVNTEPLQPLEKTKIGKIGVGIILILVGIGASTMIIGIPILFIGVWFIYDAFKAQIKNILNKSADKV
jgi:hypothetical protein